MSDESLREIEHSAWTPKVELLLQDWRRRVYAAQAAYYQEAERLRRRNYQLGIPVVIVSSMVGTAVFVDWGEVAAYKWLVGSVSIVAAILASLQTFLKLGESATLHGSAADWFAAIRRDIEETLALPLDLRGNPKDRLDSIRHEMNKAGQKAPELSERLWIRVARRFSVEEPCPGRSRPVPADKTRSEPGLGRRNGSGSPSGPVLAGRAAEPRPGEP
jgi:hypothetical protein